jgi:hypothetical protein
MSNDERVELHREIAIHGSRLDSLEKELCAMKSQQAFYFKVILGTVLAMGLPQFPAVASVLKIIV